MDCGCKATVVPAGAVSADAATELALLVQQASLHPLDVAVRMFVVVAYKF